MWTCVWASTAAGCTAGCWGSGSGSLTSGPTMSPSPIRWRPGAKLGNVSSAAPTTTHRWDRMHQCVVFLFLLLQTHPHHQGHPELPERGLRRGGGGRRRKKRLPEEAQHRNLPHCWLQSEKGKTQLTLSVWVTALSRPQCTHTHTHLYFYIYAHTPNTGLIRWKHRELGLLFLAENCPNAKSSRYFWWISTFSLKFLCLEFTSEPLGGGGWTWVRTHTTLPSFFFFLIF